MGIPLGGEDTQILNYAKKLFELFAPTGSRDEKTSDASTRTKPPDGISTT